MSPELHRWFVTTAKAISPPLARDIAAVGPLEFPERRERALGLAAFLARSIVGQQLSAKAARSIWARLEAAAAAEGGEFVAFLHAANQPALRACGLSGGKIKAILGIAEAHRRGHLAVETILALDHAGRVAHLTPLWGVGQWTCDMLSLFYFRDEDVWPEGDLAVQRVFKRYIGRRKPAKAAALFAPYRSRLALYMWKLVDGVPIAE